MANTNSPCGNLTADASCCDFRGHLHLAANRWQCAQKNIKLRTSNWCFLTLVEKGQKRGNERKKEKNKSGNLEDLWSNTITKREATHHLPSPESDPSSPLLQV